MIDKSELENIRKYQFELCMLERQLESITSASLVNSPQLSCGIRGGKIGNRVAARGDKTADLQRKIAEKRAQINLLIDCINAITDDVLRQVVFCRCVYYFRWKDISDIVGGNNTENSVKMMYNRFMTSQ